MMLVPETQVLSALIAASALMAVLWLVQRRTGNAGIVDAGWAASIGLPGILFVTTSGGYLPRRILVATLIGIWAARLAIDLLRDRVLGCPEEGRYRTLRAKWGATAQRRLFVFFQTQALAVRSSYWWLTLLAPAAILYYLLEVAGIRPTGAGPSQPWRRLPAVPVHHQRLCPLVLQEEGGELQWT